jgi:hypothetical protein
MLGLGLGLTMRGSGGSGLLDPAALSLTGWWRGAYSGSPWVGTASAGSSGSRNLTEATNPPAVGTALNGYATADFGGTNSVLSGAALSTYLNASAFSLWVLFNADAAASSAGGHYASPYLFGDSATYMFLSFDSDGLNVRVSDGATFPTVTVACATSGWHLGQVVYGSSTIGLRVDGGAWSTSATCAAISDLTSTTRTGLSYSGNAFDGRIAEIGVANSAIALASFDDVLTYTRSRYSLALT